MIVFASKSRSRSSWWPTVLAIGVFVVILTMGSCDVARRAPAAGQSSDCHQQGGQR